MIKIKISYEYPQEKKAVLLALASLIGKERVKEKAGSRYNLLYITLHKPGL